MHAITLSSFQATSSSTAKMTFMSTIFAHVMPLDIVIFSHSIAILFCIWCRRGNLLIFVGEH